jgi:high-affinity iron transporter
MIAAALIVLREVFEVALLVGIVAAATRSVPRRGNWIAGGIALGVAGSIVVAAFAQEIASALEGFGQEIFNAGVLLTATAMLGWHNVWMKTHGAQLAREMTAVGRDVAGGAASLSVILVVVGLAVLREGSEVVLFLYGIAAAGTQGSQMLMGGLLGLAGGIAIGWTLYRGLLSIPARQLFAATSWLLLLLAAGLAAQAAGFLVQAGKLPPLVEPLWDSSSWLPEGSAFGQVLHALMGYTDRPSGMQIVFFLVTALVIGVSMTLVDRRRRPGASRTPALAAIAAAAILGGALGPKSAHAAHVVYSPIVEEGELEIAYRGHHDFDNDNAVDGGEQHKIELEYSPTARWKTELLVEFEKDPGESREATEVATENIFQLTEQGAHWADFGLLAEYAHSLQDGGDDALELGLLVEKQFAANIANFNVLAERAFEGGAETELEYAFRWRYRMDQRFEPGIELHGELGEWGEFGSAGDHRHQLGPSALGKFRQPGGRHAFEYEAALLFGLTADSPDTTLRLQLEYEF